MLGDVEETVYVVQEDDEDEDTVKVISQFCAFVLSVTGRSNGTQ